MPKRVYNSATYTLRRKVRGKYAIRPKKFRAPRAYKLSTSVAGLKKYNVHSYIRWSDASTTIHDSGTTKLDGKIFAMSETINYSELTSLYDQYKIMGVKVYFHLVSNPDASNALNVTTATNSNNFYPKLWVVRDYDNDTLETLAELRQRNNTKCTVLQPNKMFSMYVRPAVKKQIYMDGITAATVPEWNQWIDCSSPTVPHYGIKFVLDSEARTPVQQWVLRVEYKYYLKFKNAR